MSATATQRPDIRRRLRDVVAAADDRKASDLKVLSLAEVSDFTDFFVVCSGRSARQVQGIADAMQSSLRDLGVRPLHVEGLQNGKWVLLDYGEMVIHVFDPETRSYYGLERLWGDADDVTDSLR